MEVEEIRAKVTKVAELFERKPISQKYTFDVLCDFINDKAKRLVQKYDALAKLHPGDNRSNYLQKKVDQLEVEFRNNK